MPISNIIFSSNNKFIASGSYDKNIKIWNIESKEGIIIGKHDDKVFSVCITSDDKYIISGSEDKTIRCWNIETKECIIIG